MIFNPDYSGFLASFQKQLKTCEFSLSFWYDGMIAPVVLFPHVNTFGLVFQDFLQAYVY